MIAAILRQPDQMLEGTPATELIPELECSPADIIVNRVHGLTPFGGTELDAVLRNMGTKTLVPIGVSVNVAIMGTCLSASDLGYQIVLPTDAVVGVPESYAADALDQHPELPGDPHDRRRHRRRSGPDLPAVTAIVTSGWRAST